MSQTLFLFPIKYDELKSNLNKANEIIKKSNLDEKTKERLYELLEFDIDNIKEDFNWTWKDVEESVDNIAPQNSYVIQVDELRKTLDNIIKGNI